jgi:hypothetical protein
MQKMGEFFLSEKGKPYQKNHPQPSQGQAQGWCVGALR